MTSLRHPAVAAVLAFSALVGAGCGSSNKIKDSGFLSKCEKSFEGQGAKVRGYATPTCTCVQRKLVAIGYGDRDYNDKALDNDPKVSSAIEACQAQVLKTGA